MPIHDWKKVDADLFHEFHQVWAMKIHDVLNGGLLPRDYSALVENHAGRLIPDVLGVTRRKHNKPPQGGGVMTMTKRVSKAATLLRGKMHRLTRRTNRVSIHHRIGTVVCVIEIVSPGNKSSELKLLDFVSKNLNYLEAGIHILVADILPPTRRDPHGIHQEIWKEIADPDSEVPPRRKPLTLAAYIASDPPEDLEIQAIVKAVAVGDTLPDMPAYLGYNRFVPIPLEATYMSAWNSCPFAMRHLIEHGKLPNDDYD